MLYNLSQISIDFIICLNYRINIITKIVKWQRNSLYLLTAVNKIDIGNELLDFFISIYRYSIKPILQQQPQFQINFHKIYNKQSLKYSFETSSESLQIHFIQTNNFQQIFSATTVKLIYNMEAIVLQNRRLKEIMKKCEEEIIQLKKIGHDHQTQIDSLLKFNQRLLTIIQNEMPNKVLSRNSSGSNLHPIDEANEKDQQLVVGHHFTTKQHPIKDKVQHVDLEEIQKLSQQNDAEFNKHVNSPANYTHDQKGGLNGANGFQYRNLQQRQSDYHQMSSGRNSSQQYPQGIIYRQEKESLIQIPKLFKLQKGLSDHYNKELFQSIEQNMKPKHLPQSPSNKTKKQLQLGMNRIQEAVSQRLNMDEEEVRKQLQQIHQMIEEYKEDFNIGEYLHLCSIIKSDLQSDYKQLRGVHTDYLNKLESKQNELKKLKENISQFDPIQKLIQIMRKLNIGQNMQELIIKRIINDSKVMRSKY